MRHNKKNEVQERLNEVILTKLDELDTLDITDENAKASAETLGKLIEAQNGTDKADELKKDFWSKVGTAALALAGTIGAAFVTALFNKKIAEEQLDFVSAEHYNAYEWEANGKTEHLVTSPTSRDVLREKPRIK